MLDLSLNDLTMFVIFAKQGNQKRQWFKDHIQSYTDTIICQAHLDLKTGSHSLLLTEELQRT